jgi:hypothetical protein
VEVLNWKLKDLVKEDLMTDVKINMELTFLTAGLNQIRDPLTDGHLKQL